MKKVMSFFIVLIICASIATTAYADSYDNYYSIHGALAYAEHWYDSYNPAYRQYDTDCTNFISQCITEGGGIPQSRYFSPDGGVDNWHPWTVPGDLFTYLTRDLGYSYDYTYATVDWNNNTISSVSSGNYTVNIGDIVFFDFEQDDFIDHAAIIVGYSNGVPCYAAHSYSRWNEPLSLVASAFDKSHTKYYFVHMTNAQGMTDVTSQFIGREVSLYSKKAGWTISVDGRDHFAIISNEYGEVGFRASDGCYLSVNIEENSISSPAFVRERNQQYWESFRIFSNGSSYFIQSMGNGKWLQVDDNGVLRAAGRAGSTWEEFDIG